MFASALRSRCGRRSRSTSITYDYTYDTNNFFGAATRRAQRPDAGQGRARSGRQLLHQHSQRHVFGDHDSAAVSQHVPRFNGVVSWDWEQRFQHPTTGADVDAYQIRPIAADQYIDLRRCAQPGRQHGGHRRARRLSAGAATSRNGRFHAGRHQPTSTPSPTNFSNAVERSRRAHRLRPLGRRDHVRHRCVAHLALQSHDDAVRQRDAISIRWRSTSWRTRLGFGSESRPSGRHWSAAHAFIGSKCQVAERRQPVPLSADCGHWANNTQSVVYGTATAQEAAMDPDLLNGTRKRFTDARRGRAARTLVGS